MDKNRRKISVVINRTVHTHTKKKMTRFSEGDHQVELSFFCFANAIESENGIGEKKQFV